MQVDGVAMGSQLGPTLANPFLVHFEENWLQNCPSDFKPHYYRWYVDYMFVLFTSAKNLEAIRNFLNGVMLICRIQLNVKSKTECLF